MRRFPLPLAAAVVFVACGDPANPDPEPLDARITITPDSQAAWTGDTLVLAVSFDGPDRDSLMRLPLTWRVSDTSLAQLAGSSDASASIVPRRAGVAIVEARVGDVADTAAVTGWEEGELLAVREWATSTETSLQSLAVGTDGVVYLLRAEGAVLSFDAELVPAWEVPVYGPGWMSPAVADDGSIIVPTLEGVFALSPDGSPRWRDTTTGAIESAPAIDGQGHVWLGGYRREGTQPYPWGVAHYDAAGTRVAFLETGRTIKVPPVIVLDSVVVIGDLGGRVFGIARSDSILWIDTLASPIRYFPPAVAGDGRTVYVATRDGPVVALDGITGEVFWIWQGTGAPTSPIVDADGTVYVQTQASLVALAPDGSVAWQADSLKGLYGINALGAPALATGGVLYLACQTDVCAVNTADGSVRWRRAPPVGVPDGTIPGSIFVLPDSSVLYSTISKGDGPGYLVKLRGRFPLADAPWPVDGGNLRRTRRGPVP
jgi:outer membrane protein assembly factor BamB